jgi:AraC-like DNA-binding protein
MDGRVLKAVALIQDNLHREVTTGGLATAVNLSPSRLHQLFKDEIDLSPGKYLRLLRMQRAKDLLENTFLSVKQIMAKIGVTDESHFVRDFKRTYGFTPARYRRQCQNGRVARVSRRDRDLLTSIPAPARRRIPSRGSATSPLLLRRPSHPYQLARERLPRRPARKFKELMELLVLRHIAFAELTTEVTAKLARSKLKARAISYLPRPGIGVANRLPPAAEHLRVSNLSQSATFLDASRVYSEAIQRNNRAS